MSHVWAIVRQMGSLLDARSLRGTAEPVSITALPPIRFERIRPARDLEMISADWRAAINTVEVLRLKNV